MLALLVASAVATQQAAGAVAGEPRVETAAAQLPAGVIGEEDRAGSASVALQAEGGVRGERHLSLRAQAKAGPVSLELGGETSAGPSASERRAAILFAELDLEGLAPHAELRAAPEQDGVSRFAAELGLRRDGSSGSLGATLLGRTTASRRCPTCRTASLETAGLAIEGELEAASGLRLGIAAAAWALRLTASREKEDPWLAFGSRTLDWADRWDLSASVREKLFFGALTLQGGLSQPAADVPPAPRGAVGADLELGTLALSLLLGAHRLPAGPWEPQAAVGLRVRVASGF